MTRTIIKARAPAPPKKRGPKPGTRYHAKVDHVCPPPCGVHFKATAKAIYHDNRCQAYARRRRLGIPERKPRAATTRS